MKLRWKQTLNGIFETTCDMCIAMELNNLFSQEKRRSFFMVGMLSKFVKIFEASKIFHIFRR